MKLQSATISPCRVRRNLCDEYNTASTIVDRSPAYLRTPVNQNEVSVVSLETTSRNTIHNYSSMERKAPSHFTSATLALHSPYYCMQ